MASARKNGKKTKDNDQIASEPEVLPAKNRSHLFQKGNSYGGRPKGARNKLSEAVIQDILADWEVAGASAIQACRLENPGVYLRVVTSLVPKEFKVTDANNNQFSAIIDQLTDEQLAQLYGLLTSFGVDQGGSAGKVKAIT